MGPLLTEGLKEGPTLGMPDREGLRDGWISTDGSEEADGFKEGTRVGPKEGWLEGLLLGMVEG